MWACTHTYWICKFIEANILIPNWRYLQHISNKNTKSSLHTSEVMQLSCYFAIQKCTRVGLSCTLLAEKHFFIAWKFLFTFLLFIAIVRTLISFAKAPKGSHHIFLDIFISFPRKCIYLEAIVAELKFYLQLLKNFDWIMCFWSIKV